jgi:23S rRNA (cytidine1920-2'-O)/16S rRNA (cytidine1409-2'-O)-methyltransferase
MTKQNTSKPSGSSMPPSKERLDKVIKKRGLIRSRSRAQRMIAAGRVKVDGRILTRPGHPIDSEADIEILSFERYVSQGGDKLEAALDQFGIDPTGMTCLDVGASTGGFTDCLLQHGAAKVHAIDVGHDQLTSRIRRHPKVVVREGLNARYLEPQDIGEPIDLIVIDVSFISLKLILPPLVALIESPGQIIALVKPQFEVGKDHLPGDGVVKDEVLRQRTLSDIRLYIEAETPWHVLAEMQSPIQGEKGNVEFLLQIG